MPDTWTTNPEKLKNALIETGAKCEAEPRVITDRDSFWTCHIDLETMREDGLIGYDIYIHDINDIYTSQPTISYFIIIFAIGLLTGFLWRPRFNKKK